MSAPFDNPDEILAGLDPEQREVAVTLSGPVCVLAGAGTGKTRAITHRIAYAVARGSYNPSTVLAVTFTSRAAAEMRTRLRALGAPQVQARTFHAAALRQLQYFWPQTVGGEVPSIVEHKARLVAEAAKRLRLSVDRATLRDIAGELEWAKVSMLTPESYESAAKDRQMPPDLDQRALARIFQSYEDLKTDRNAIDFEDVLLITVGLLEEDERVAAAVHQQYRHFVVDEYQDVSPLQHRLLRLWLGERNELCVVGDASQTIYSFTGARSDFLQNFSQEFPGTATIKLIRDYRSSPQIVALANKLLARRTPEFQLRHSTQGVWPAPLQLISQRSPGPEPTFNEFADDEQEANAVTAQIEHLLAEGVHPKDIAVLFRTNGQSETYERALSQRGVPYQVRGAERFFTRREIREAVAQLKSASLAPGPEPMPVLVEGLLTGLGYRKTPPENGGAVRERWESLSALVELAKEIEAEHQRLHQRGMSLREFVGELQQRAITQHAPTGSAVTLASLHSAKGLEWRAVFLVGISEGLLPISFARTQSSVDEERRLLYVGITRAQEYLWISWSLSRTAGSRGNRQPSRFLDGLRPIKTSTTARRVPERTKRKERHSATRAFSNCRICAKPLVSGVEKKIGRCQDCPPSYSPETFERLRSWRLDRAKEADVPAFVVFTDATLTAIAELAPTSLPELLQISGVGARKLELYGEQVLRLMEADEQMAAEAKNSSAR